MTTTLKQKAANKKNAQKSTGPVTSIGKANSSTNATKHGVLSSNLILPGESKQEYQNLFDDLISSLKPAGILELTIVEKIGINLWRQRRLVHAETAEIELQLTPLNIAKLVTKILGCSGNAVSVSELESAEEDNSDWYTTIISEFDMLNALAPGEFSWAYCEMEAPNVFDLVEKKAFDNYINVDIYEKKYFSSLQSCLARFEKKCHDVYHRRNEIIPLAELARIKLNILNGAAEEKFSRYQITLNNEFHKLINTLRELKKMQSQFIDGEAKIVN